MSIPYLLEQTSRPQYAQPADVSQAVLWNYAFRFYHGAEPADIVTFAITLNGATDASTRTAEFTLTLDALFNTEHGVSYYRALYLQRTGGDETIDWPTLFVKVDNDVVVQGHGVDSERGRRYDFASAHVEAGRPLTFDIEFGGLSIAVHESAAARIQLTAGGETGDWIRFPQLHEPMLSWSDALPAGEWCWKQNDNPVTHVFAALRASGIADRTVGVAMHYTIMLSPAGLPISMPVFLLPLVRASDDATARMIETARTWYDQNQPASLGEWSFTITTYSDRPAHGKQPLLVLPFSSSNAGA